MDISNILDEIDLPGLDLDNILTTEELPADADEAPPVLEKAYSILGDVFEIDGKHRIMCGDSTKESDVSILMNGKKAELGLTDPPYNLNFSYNSYNDNKTADEYYVFCASFYEQLKNNTEMQIITPGKQNLKHWFTIGEINEIAVWVAINKMSGGKVSNLSLWEPIIFYGKFNRNSRPTDLYDYNVKQQTDTADHTCPKVIALIIDIVKHYSKTSVLDLFLGSGSTLIAAETTKRICYGMELDQHYCDVILRRYKKTFPNASFKCLTRADFPFEEMFNAGE